MDLDKKKKNIIVIVVVILILAATVLSIYYNGPLIDNFSQTDTSSRPANNTTDQTANRQQNTDYFNSINIDVTVPKGVSTFFTGVDELANINNDDTVITYISPNSININNVIDDILSEFAVTDELNLEGCTNVDQLAVIYQQKTCTNDRCLDRYGNRIFNKQIIEEISTRDDIPKCTGQELGYLSFNFVVDPGSNLVSKETLFMDISEIYIGTSIYKEFKANSNLDYYFRHNFFIEDTNIGISDMVPRIVHSSFSRNDYKQKILIKRYDKGGIENPVGNLAELIFRPGQLFLAADSVTDSISTFPPGADLSVGYTGNYAPRVIFQGTNATAKCILDEDKNIHVIDGGKDYDMTQTVSIVNDAGTASGAYNINIFKFSKRLVMKKRTDFNNENRAVWLLAPPINLSPQTITKQNKLTKGYIIDFSNQSPVSNIDKAIPEALPTYSKVAPGTIISAIPVNNITETVYDQVLVPNQFLSNNGILTNTDHGPAYYENIKYLYSGEINNTLFEPLKTSQKLNNETYAKYPDFLLKAVNTYPMFANPQNFIEGAIVDVSVFEIDDIKAGPVVFYSDYVASVGFCIDGNMRAPVDSNGIILDGSAEWQTINPFSQVIAFTNEYFKNPSIIEFGSNAASNISDITNPVGGVSFVTPIFGKINSIDPTTADYGDVTLPTNLTGAVVVDLNDTNLVVETNSNGVIGTGAKCILSFLTAPGASTIIQSAQVTEAGKGFTTGTFGLSARTISSGVTGYINGITINAVNDSYLFEAVTIKESDNITPVTPTELSLDATIPIRFGLTIDPVKNKAISLTDHDIINGGQNYETSIKVYINQFASGSVESIFGSDYNPEQITTTFMQKLPYVTINSIVSNTGASVFPAPYPLIVNDTIPGICYNFWEDSPGLYNSSPQQLIYYGDFIGVSLAYNGDPADDIEKYFLNNKIDESAFTDIEFLSSLQIPSFYYQNSNDEIPIVNPYEGLVLKRFIPYRAYKPPMKNGDEEIPTVPNPNTFVNYNYCQFVPFGTRNFYN